MSKTRANALSKFLATQAIFFLVLLVIPATTLAQTTTKPVERLTTVQNKIASREAKVAQRLDNIEKMLEDRRAKIASQAATLQAKLAKFKDAQKAKRVENINTNLNKINDNRVAAMNRFLDKASTILDKVEARVNGVTDKDTTAAKAAIADARAAIETARVAVETQSTKNYSITLNSETTAKVDAQKAYNSLRTDLQATKQIVTTAKQAVAKAIQVAATTLGETNGQ